MLLVLLTDRASALKASFKGNAIKALDASVGSSVVRIIMLSHLQRTDSNSRLTGNCTFCLSVCTHYSGRYCADRLDSVTIIGSWIFHKPLPLLFDTFEAIVLFMSGLSFPSMRLLNSCTDQILLCTVLLANYVLKDGKSNWMEGMILICTFIQYFRWAYHDCHFTMHLFQLLAHNCVLGIFAIFAVTFCYYPGSNVPDSLIGCGS